MIKFWKRSKHPTAAPDLLTVSHQKAFSIDRQTSASGQFVAANPSPPGPWSPPFSDVDRCQPPAFEVIASLLTDVGCCRDVNEDSSCYVRPVDERIMASKGMLALVADGVGGHSAGEIASRIATDMINRLYYEDDADAATALRKAFHAANREIYNAAQRDEALWGMATTCIALVLRHGAALWAHVGDSRLYLVREGEIYALTEDHSAVMEMVRLGFITREEARHHAEKNVILRALGSRPDVEVEVCDAPLPVKAGDKFLLCSDGLYDLVSDQEIKRAVIHKTPPAACESLINLARERGGFDNITVAVLCLETKPERTPVYAGREVAGAIRS